MPNIVHASMDEHGHLCGGAAGDQNGKEVCVRAWYQKGWNLMIRYKDSAIAAKAVAIAIKLANSNLVGYDQGQRLSLYSQLAKHKFDVDKYIKSKVKTECDCSSFVHACFSCAVSSVRGGYAPPTSSMTRFYTKSKGFSQYRDSKFTGGTSNLQIGDILVKEDHHTVIYAGSTKAVNKAESTPLKDSSSTDSGSTPAPAPKYDHENDRHDAVLREVGYLNASFEPSIVPSSMPVSLVNITSLLAAQHENSDTGVILNDDADYNVDQLTPKQREVIEFLVGKGLNLAASVGILANIIHESNINTACIGDNGTSFGICQWHNERGSSMKSYVGSNWASNLTGQLKYLWHELTTGYSGVLSDIKKVTDTVDGAKRAADIFVRRFEVPAKVEEQTKKRQATAESLWKKCSVSLNTSNDNNKDDEDPNDPVSPEVPTKSKKKVTIPKDVRQTGLCPNNSNYSYYYPRWDKTTVQRKLADIWNSTGRNHKGYIATISGYYLVAVSPIFGHAGDIIKVNVRGGGVFTAIIADEKGSDATSKYGHVISNNGEIDVIEWEIKGSETIINDLDTKSKCKIPYRGKKVESIENYGKYWEVK